MTRAWIYLLAAGTALAAFWFTLRAAIGQAKEAAKNRVRFEQTKRKLKNVEKANQVDQDIDGLSPDERRRRLLQRYGRK